MNRITPVVTGASQILAHTPGLARHGSKPSRELPGKSDVESNFLNSLRSFDEALGYAPHQAYLGTLHPRDLPERPWTDVNMPDAERFTPDGEIMPELEFLAMLALVDEFDLIKLDADAGEEGAGALEVHKLIKALPTDRIAKSFADVEAAASQMGALPLHLGASQLAAAMLTAHPGDQALASPVLLENLACKASATLALLHLLDKQGTDPKSVDYVISCSEEAVGDRYQRGGGNLAKGIAWAAGLSEASGVDVKNFCAAPIPALVIAASLVASGVFQKVAVVAGGSLPKLGMKFQGHLKHSLPILEDVIGGCAAMVEADDGRSPVIRTDVVGRHKVSQGGSNPQIMEALAIEPLDRAGLKMTDIDDFATELHNPEITEPQGSGNVAERNYKTIAALGVQRGKLRREDISDFATNHGMPGFAPTQGHLASALCYLPHALRRLTDGQAQRVHMIAKGSLFLGRMSQLSDGMSVLLERNNRR